MTNGFIIRMILLWLLGLSLNEVSVLIGWVFPQTIKMYVENWYFDKSYKPPQVTVLYYIYELAPYIENVIRSYIFFKVACLVSFRLAKVTYWFAMYYISQVLFYVWNRNTSGLTNLVLFITVSLILLDIALPSKAVSKYKSIK